ncbi:TonB-dependent receptor [Kordia sp.]|uniref:TonB-dependent receptor n=1 Tax=Kordia sp. TaxID=1965332 RepID=UPI0025C25EED|nr:TonB-dependent receptor [Kordia sp.]MCH2192588.1 TonB-dependent receptor [Kordia sp.]
MKNIFFSVLLGILFTCNAFAQTTYQGNITDIDKKPIFGATIVSVKNAEKGSMSDENGNFSITLNDTNTVYISMMGFARQKVTLDASKTTQIVLVESFESLDNVIISASREQQKRAEVPASVSVLTVEKIQERKAFGIDQLVNQVPGVFLSTSTAASNEQHFMATRTPISTKSLFLYLEDGLPIRPVAVFNHNALLEMNNTSFGRVEVLKGPASSIYGSESVGGSFNFLTKNPTKELSGSVGFQINDLGLTHYELEISNSPNENFGFYLGTHYVQRKKGPVGHSDYEKFALTFKTVNDISDRFQWINALTLVDYRSDMTGSLSERNYSAGNYESNQTFTERDALAFRFRSTFEALWNVKQKTTFNLIFRNNQMDQNPSYRVRQFRQQGQLTGFGSGEVNSNKFKSYVGLIQHKIDFNFAASSLIAGITADFSPQKYIGQTTNVIVNPETGLNTSFTINSNDFILNYEADIFNYAGYLQYEISPLDKLKITAAIRFDKFLYDYDNKIENTAGVQDTEVDYDNISPKLGVNYNFSNTLGIYANYANGFTPPQTSTLFRKSRNNDAGGTIFDLNPAIYNNYEVGGYFAIPNTLQVDLALYQLDGKDQLISLRDDEGNFIQRNSGETRSRGIELGLTYTPYGFLELNASGSYTTHEYISFFDNGIDYSGTDMQTAPNLLANTTLAYKPFKNFRVAVNYEHVGDYNTSFEGQAVIGEAANGDDILGTTTYGGHHIFNAQLSYRYQNIEVWGHALNLFDKLYSVRASYNRFRGENSYTIGNPRAFHFGISYSF